MTYYWVVARIRETHDGILSIVSVAITFIQTLSVYSTCGGVISPESSTKSLVAQADDCLGVTKSHRNPQDDCPQDSSDQVGHMIKFIPSP